MSCEFLLNKRWENLEQRASAERFCELLEWDWEFQSQLPALYLDHAGWALQRMLLTPMLAVFDNPVFGTQCGHHSYNYRLQPVNTASFEIRAAHAKQLRELIQAEVDGGLLGKQLSLYAR